MFRTVHAMVRTYKFAGNYNVYVEITTGNCALDNLQSSDWCYCLPVPYAIHERVCLYHLVHKRLHLCHTVHKRVYLYHTVHRRVYLYHTVHERVYVFHTVHECGKPDCALRRNGGRDSDVIGRSRGHDRAGSRNRRNYFRYRTQVQGEMSQL